MKWVVCKQSNQGSVLKRITLAVAGTCLLKFSTSNVGSFHVRISIEGETPLLEKCLRDIWTETLSVWNNTRHMLNRKGFDCYMMIEDTKIKQFIGKDGIGIRRLRKLNNCNVFVTPMLLECPGKEPSVYFEIWTKSRPI